MKSILNRMMKVIGLSAIALFQMAAGMAIVALVCHDLAAGRFRGWEIVAAIACGIVLGLGGMLTSFGYAAWAKAIR